MSPESQRLVKQSGVSSLSVRVTDDEEGTCKVECAGPIDIRTAPRFGEGLKRALERAPGRLVVDLRQVSRIDSVGVRHVVDAYTRLSPGARLEVRSRDPRVYLMLKIAGVPYGTAGSSVGVA